MTATSAATNPLFALLPDWSHPVLRADLEAAVTVSPGDIVEHDGEHRVVVDVDTPEDMSPVAVLRFPDDDDRREVDEDGGDVHLSAALCSDCRVVGRIS